MLSVLDEHITLKGLLDTYDPPAISSKNCQYWVAHISPTTCELCINMDGKIYSIYPNCNCEVIPMEAIVASNKRIYGKNGADFWVKYLGRLPNYYIG